MGRKKIQITRIVDERNRQVTFMKRKFGLMKKAYELSVLCDCEIALIIFNSSNKLFQYASTDMDKVLLKYTEYNEPHESRTNSDIVEALNKKEHRGCDSPDADASYVLTPHTEEKYKKINEEFDNMMKSHKITPGPPQQNFMHGSMSYSPGGGGGGGRGRGGGGGGGETSHALAAATAALADSGILSSPHTHLQRNMNPPHRPPSTGNTGGLQSSSDMALQNGSGPVVNGFVGSPGGGSLVKLISPKSPSPLPHLGNNLVPASHKTDLRVVIPQSKGLMQSLGSQRQSPSSQSLSTPVVSVNTPSLPHQSLVYCGISSAYNNDYALSSAEPPGFGSPAGHSMGSMTAWQHQLGSLGSGSTNHHLHIKAEPISPPRDHLSQGSGYMTHAHAPPHPLSSTRAEMGRSPADSVSSSCSSHEGGSDREEQQRLDFLTLPMSRSEGSESPTVKRMRMDSWVS
uniref:MADS-box domain-containing protein n=1 Tax=Gasterosteus aculeatus aculeatus TaxID=481459 RepID=G3PPT2_GASAC|nr:myocyte-specific enhancer factor 2A-like [Gasterosteus aculeatus aculeatus]XP_040021402.1 myocyte-specific enhancer factor 2A-like [Gasterosteus aculeatus aculeatus]XP_040021410.1 myocyte-specific enhancer factor 2A-like [Gasterosteus aculeatus aculeatus]XP_040021419.1 myocyte-specific enhancer factor 2A-like [Gasterosteus aculeatus aculeatus]XP_040021427.1 myocyte-specific enhancer factor 2A-like [Gasterosteus aculeatus aculeatus]